MSSCFSRRFALPLESQAQKDEAAGRRPWQSPSSPPPVLVQRGSNRAGEPGAAGERRDEPGRRAATGGTRGRASAGPQPAAPAELKPPGRSSSCIGMSPAAGGTGTVLRAVASRRDSGPLRRSGAALAGCLAL